MNLATRRTARLGALFVLAAVLLGASPQVDRATVLLKIERQQAAGVTAATLAETHGLQELQSGWVAEASGEVAARLGREGVRLTVLDPAPAGKQYFLIFARTPNPPAVSSLTAALPLEEGVWLVAAADDRLRERLPGELDVAPLSLSPPARVRPYFEAAGAVHSLPRSRATDALAAPDARIAAAVAAVSTDRLAATIRELEGFQSRYATTTNLAAAGNYLFDQFRGRGHAAEYDDFTFSSFGYPATNIVATLPGRASAADVVIIGAHYDSFSDRRPTLAPGADDNASGTSVVMEAARVLAGMPFDFTIRFVAFSAEEWGLYGSRHYAEAARQRGERIIGMVNLDMVGFVDRAPEELETIVNPASEWMADRFGTAAATYAPLAVRKVVNASSRSSDHAPFWDAGYSALECIEDLPLTNPYYHKTTDRFETLDMTFVSAVAKAAVALVAELAQPVGPVATPTGLQVTPETARSLFARAKRYVLRWSPAPGATGYNVYRATAPHGSYRRVNATVVREAAFTDAFVSPTLPAYYVVTAVDAQGRESNYSTEASGQ